MSAGYISQWMWQTARRINAAHLGRSLAGHWPFPVRVKVTGGHSMYVDLRSTIGRGLFATGTFDMAAIEPALSALSPGATYIDVGANIGFYAVLAAERVGPTGRVYCFEIDSRPLRAFRKTVATFPLKNIEIVKVAVAATDGIVSFKQARDHGHNRIDPSGATGNAIRSVRLDTWVALRRLERVDVIKIDVEGAEYLVLDGAREMIARFKPTIICEAMHGTPGFAHGPADVVALLQAHQYEVQYLPGVHTPTVFARPEIAAARKA